MDTSCSWRTRRSEYGANGRISDPAVVLLVVALYNFLLIPAD
jgi:hypothetical protein